MIAVTINRSDDKTAGGICNGKPFAAVLDTWAPDEASGA